ncbi:cation transporter [Brachybacterium sp. p3-SID957]|uniref:cation transporter n=1 Tax=Brachybacterium sp. p3-SID957 TaxID=2916049 RepID=UPI0021E4DC10|nr:cation transporter [Brachybacterium sp. p3-SID957]MCT1775436.1 cation transporter [Brachybacterium sp. p3-SID957]
MDSRDLTSSMRRLVAVVAGLNLIGCVVEGVIAWRIGSVALFADAADFLEDFLINTLVLVAAGWPLASRRKASYALAGLILLPAIAALWTAIHRILEGGTPQPLVLGATGIGALMINLVCAMLLVRLRSGHGSLGRGAWLAARNDALANVLIIVAGAVMLMWASPIPDIVVGLVIAAVNAGAAVEVFREAREEHPELELDGD